MQEGFVIFYESRKLKENQNNYATHDFELASIVHALKMWRKYFLGRRLELMIDHVILKYLFDQPRLNVRKYRWLKFLCEFDFEIKYVKGKENKVSYALSRKFHVISFSMCKFDLRTRVLKAQNSNETYLQVKENLQQGKLDENVKHTSLEKMIFLFIKIDCILRIVYI